MPVPSESPSREGELLAQKYRLGKRLGAGGQGEVYRARNELIGRDVAIKLLRAEWVADPTTLARFMREARAANMVRHSNVVDVLDIGTDESGTPFIVQELLDGLSLDDHLDARGGRLLPPEVFDLMIAVCDAVGAAHERGVVHRDLKPGNVFLVTSGTALVPKVLDFGLSKIHSAHGEVDVTTTGSWFGSPAYMPPEQIRHTRTVDARSDVWALGVMLYELLAGRRPFESQTVGDLFVVICTEDPVPLREFAPHIAQALATVVHRCLVRDPALRYASAKELGADLRAARSGGELMAMTAGGETSPARPDDPSARETVGPPRPMRNAEDANEPDEQATRPATPLKIVSPARALRTANDAAEVRASAEGVVPATERSANESGGRSTRGWWVGAVAVGAIVAIAGFARFGPPMFATKPAMPVRAAVAPTAASASRTPVEPAVHVQVAPSRTPPTVSVVAPEPTTTATNPPLAQLVVPAPVAPRGTSGAHRHGARDTTNVPAAAGTANATVTPDVNVTAPTAQPAASASGHEMHGATNYE